jgi:Na+/melibiose symporter-like transporter
MLLGQTTDAIMTPLIGILSDKYDSPRVGKRKFWYLIGFLIVAGGFTLTFQPCLFCMWFSITTVSM